MGISLPFNDPCWHAIAVFIAAISNGLIKISPFFGRSCSFIATSNGLTKISPFFGRSCNYIATNFGVNISST
jgi:hypothetical protein